MVDSIDWAVGYIASESNVKGRKEMIMVESACLTSLGSTNSARPLQFQLLYSERLQVAEFSIDPGRDNYIKVWDHTHAVYGYGGTTSTFFALEGPTEACFGFHVAL